MPQKASFVKAGVPFQFPHRHACKVLGMVFLRKSLEVEGSCLNYGNYGIMGIMLYSLLWVMQGFQDITSALQSGIKLAIKLQSSWFWEPKAYIATGISTLPVALVFLSGPETLNTWRLYPTPQTPKPYKP